MGLFGPSSNEFERFDGTEAAAKRLRTMYETNDFADERHSVSVDGETYSMRFDPEPYSVVQYKQTLQNVLDGSLSIAREQRAVVEVKVYDGDEMVYATYPTVSIDILDTTESLNSILMTAHRKA